MEGNINQQLLGEVTIADQVSFKDKLWSETKKLWILATPAICTRVSTFGIYVITQAFVGHIGSTELAAFSFVYTVILRFANGILVCLYQYWCLFILIEKKKIPRRNMHLLHQELRCRSGK